MIDNFLVISFTQTPSTPQDYVRRYISVQVFTVYNVRCPLFTRGSGCAGWFYKSNTVAHFQEYSPPFPQLWEVGVLYSAQYTLTRVAQPFLRDVCVLKCFYFNSIFHSSLCYPPFPSPLGKEGVLKCFLL